MWPSSLVCRNILNLAIIDAHRVLPLANGTYFCWLLGSFDAGQGVCDYFCSIWFDKSGCSMFILCIFCPRPKISRVSEEESLVVFLLFLKWHVVFRELNPGLRGVHCPHSAPSLCFPDKMHCEPLLTPTPRYLLDPVVLEAVLSLPLSIQVLHGHQHPSSHLTLNCTTQF